MPLPVNLSQRFEAPCEGDPFSLYRTLREINASPFGGFLDWGEFVLVSSSPERLIRWDGTWAETRPIAGTFPRGHSRLEASANREALILDPKERAEHLMLVDLERNDLGRVSEFGSVRVTELMAAIDALKEAQRAAGVDVDRLQEAASVVALAVEIIAGVQMNREGASRATGQHRGFAVAASRGKHGRRAVEAGRTYAVSRPFVEFSKRAAVR